MSHKVGIIGTGAIGVEHLRRIHGRIGGASVVAVSDIDAARAKDIAGSIGARALATGKEVVAAPDVDVVVVTSWGPTHEEFVLASIAAGKPVFCEKPLATTADGCRRIVDAEVKHGKRLVQVGFMRRYDAGYRALKAVVAGGQVGAPLMVHCAHRNPSVGDSYTTDMAITDTVIHEIDVLRWLLDDDYVAVQVVYPRKTRNASSHLKDPQLVLMETARGARVDVEVFVNCKYGYDIQCEVVGETGIARLPEPAGVLMRSEARRSVPILVDWKQRFIDAYDVELQAFFDELRAGKLTGPSSWDGYAAALTADACVEAQKTGKVVPVQSGHRPGLYG
ncbi:MAG TPA: Gfo/Idh/MocA family oxidoreductase [Anaeromyxobacteraceae bacterium]|nr:Gfo/Idh/MocA family oxidoreductase [Anaeromyxobacteraceae bacterium]